MLDFKSLREYILFIKTRMTMQRKPFQIAFIGGGINSAIGEVHKAACQMDGFFKLVAGAFSSHPEINRKTAEAWNVEPSRTYSTYQELLDSEQGKIDAVVILVPTDLHKEVALCALEKKIPVICEKSLAVSVEEGLEIAKAVKNSNSFFCTTYNYTGYPMVRELAEMIKQGELGSIQQIQIEMPQEGFLRLQQDGNFATPQAWRLKETSIPKISLDLGSHLHNMVQFLTKEKPIRIVADEATFGNFPQIIDNVGALAQYTNGLKAQFWFSKTALGQRNGLRIRIYGNKGSAEWFQLEPEILKTCDAYGKISLIDRTGNLQIANLPRYNRFKAGHPAGFIEAFANYYQDIAESLSKFLKDGLFSSQYVCGISGSLESLVMMEAAARSAKTLKWEEIQEVSI